MLRTPLYDYHIEHNGNMVDFAGWEMPIRYGSIIEEHNRVRTSGGLFDVSHMGRLKLKGRHARRLLERLCTRRISDMQQGQCRYSLVCNDSGGVRDDVLVYRLDDDLFNLVVNASNREKIIAHIGAIRGDLKFDLTDQTTSTAMVALQGPRVMDLIANVSSEVPSLKRYRFTQKNLMVMKLLISRTGYTGEDGVEVILPAKMAGMALKLLHAQDGADEILAPVGLGARDTLRLEAGMPLYGHELGEDIPALACGMGFAMNLDKDGDANGEPCVGVDALRKQEQEGTPTTLVGIVLDGKRSARQGMSVKAGDTTIGTVTSACASPTLGKPIAMAYVTGEHAETGTSVLVDTGKTTLEGTITALPFYKAPKK
ncbi:MAG: glycine cleavage system aminomethyltransferase GcvT [Planctomycetota bacterium]|jgi:aminomethyltransferase